jgi:hypothetical protein
MQFNVTTDPSNLKKNKYCITLLNIVDITTAILSCRKNHCIKLFVYLFQFFTVLLKGSVYGHGCWLISWDAPFESRLVHPLTSLMFFVVLPTLFYYCFLSNSFQFFIHLSSYHSKLHKLDTAIVVKLSTHISLPCVCTCLMKTSHLSRNLQLRFLHHVLMLPVYAFL